MANPFPAAVRARLAASGGVTPVHLFELQTLGGQLYLWSDANIAVPSMLATLSGVAVVGNAPAFLPWIMTPPDFKSFKSTQTTTGSVKVQNISGDTIRREAALTFSKNELVGGIVYYRRWLIDCEYSTYDFMGRVLDVDLDADGEAMSLSLEGLANWSKLKAPNQEIGVSCGLTFGSVACGSTSPVPCTNSYGTCTSINRFNGIVLEWDGAALDYEQASQPAPVRQFNARVAG